MSLQLENPSTPSEVNENSKSSPEHQESTIPELSTTQPIQPQVAQLAGQDFLTPLPVPNPPNATTSTSSSPPRTLWMGDLDPWSDEESVIHLWASLGKRVLVKLIRAKKGTPAANLNTGHAGYCFIEFESYDDAKSALSLNGSQISNTNRSFRLNWASSATLSAPVPQSPEYSLFVGDLSPSTTEAHLLALFQAHFKSVKTVRVMTDPITGTSRCFGFVRFSDEEERRRALTEMSGVWCAGRPLRVALATPRNTAANNNNNMALFNGIPNGDPSQFTDGSGYSQFQQPPLGGSGSGNGSLTNNDILMYQYQQIPPPIQFYHPDQQLMAPISHPSNPNQSQIPPGASLIDGPAPVSSLQSIPYSDPNNTTVFVGGLASGIPEQTLGSLFQPFGPISHVKIPQGKGCGFIRFEKREDAEAAIAGMQGFQIGGSRVRLSWGRQQNQQRLQMASLALGGHPSGSGLNNHQVPGNLSQGLMPSSSSFNSENGPIAVGGNIERMNDPNAVYDNSVLSANGFPSQQMLATGPVSNLYYLPNAGKTAFGGEYDQSIYQQNPYNQQPNFNQNDGFNDDQEFNGNNDSTPESK